MGPREVELVRLFPKETHAEIAGITFPIWSEFELVAEAESGQSTFSSGAQFRVFVLLRDITGNNDIALAPKEGTGTPNIGATVNMATAAWPYQLTRFEYTVKPAALTGRANHFCQAIAFLTVGAHGEDTSYEVSGYFMLTD